MSKSLKKLIDINRLREFKNKLVGTDSAYVQTGAVDQTVAGTKTFSKPIVGSVTGSSGSCTGNAATATNATNSNAANQLQAFVNDNFTGGNHYVKAIRSSLGWSTHLWMCYNNGAKMADEVSVNYADYAGSATKLATARTINDTDFDGTANITTANWGTARNISITDGTNTSTAVSVNGSANVSLNLPSTIKATFVGNVTGNVTGNCSGSSGSCTGNAATATNATYTNWLRTSSHSDHLFHTEWDGAYFWTYVTAGNGDYRAVRVARSDSSGNADTANSAVAANYAKSVSTPDNSHTITFDWSSQVSDCVGLRVDVTDMGGIVTTNRLVSAIRAQWYAAYPDGAEAHNAMWGGRDITAAFDSGEFSEHVADGTFRDIFPGDYITKQVTIPQVLADDGTTVLFAGGTYTVNWVIADCDYWINKGDPATTVHHVVIVPQTPIFDARMNSTNTAEGGYASSLIYKKTIPACATGIVSAFGSSHILTFSDAITNSVDTSHVSSGIPQWTGTPGWWGEWVSVQCNLMSEKMVYGAPICSGGAMDNTMATRQMSAFRLSERLINYNCQNWWLRDVVSSAAFAYVHGSGNANTTSAFYVFGVRPFALLV